MYIVHVNCTVYTIYNCTLSALHAHVQGNVFDEHLYLLLISFLHTSNHWLEASLPHILPLRPPPLQLLASPSPSAAPLWFSKKLSINSPKVWCDNRRKSSVRRKELGSWRRQFRGKTKVARHHCLCCRRIFRSNRKLIYSYWGMKLCKVSKRKCARILLPGFSSHPRSLPKRVFQPFQFVEGMQSWGNLTWSSESLECL